jgi:hypothetical protein
MELKDYLKNYAQIKNDEGFKKFSDDDIQHAELFCDLIKNGNFNPKFRNPHKDSFSLDIIKSALNNGKTLILVSDNPKKYIDRLKEYFGEKLLINGNSLTLK